MNRFGSELRRVNAMLDLPQPARSRVILEISADMEDMYRHYVGRGIAEDDARRRTVAEFDLSPETVAGLAAVHDASFARFLARFSVRTRNLAEKAALAFVLVVVALVAFRLAQSGGMTADSGLWKWPILAGTVAAVALGAVKWYRLFVVKAHNIRDVRRGIDAALYIALAQITVGFAGMYADLFVTWTWSSAEPASTVVYLAHWLHRSAALLSTALIAALASGLIWIVNSGKAASIEQYAAESILDSEGETS